MNNACPSCGETLIQKPTKAGGTFMGCPNWPKCPGPQRSTPPSRLPGGLAGRSQQVQANVDRAHIRTLRSGLSMELSGFAQSCVMPFLLAHPKLIEGKSWKEIVAIVWKFVGELRRQKLLLMDEIDSDGSERTVDVDQ